MGAPRFSTTGRWPAGNPGFYARSKKPMNPMYLLFAAGSLLVASVGMTAETNQETLNPLEKMMNPPAVSLGYVILYVKDVPATLTFYEEAFK